MSLVYTITSGYLECEDEKSTFPFALVFFEDGVYRNNSIFDISRTAINN